MPTLRQLKYLVTVAETLHFRKAAEMCNISQPTLSTQLKQLEDKLGVQLVERSRHRVLLTQTGKEIAAKAREVLRDVQDLVDLADRDRNLLEGTLKLGVPGSIGPYLFPHILPELHKRHPGLNLYLREDTAPELVYRLSEGDLDLLIVPLLRTTPDLETMPLFDEPLWLSVNKNHDLARRKTVRARDLKGQDVLILETGHHLNKQIMQLCLDVGATAHLDFAATSLDTLRQMVAMNTGTTLLPALYVKAEAREDDHIAVLPFEGQKQPGRSIGLVWRAKSARRAEFIALGQLIRKMLKKNVKEVHVAK